MSRMALDQFYTNSDVATHCYGQLASNINLDAFDIVLEPSAGTGSFFKLMPPAKRIGLDLEPKHDGIRPLDYFNFVPDPKLKYVVVGNPPFGRVCKTAVQFFNHSATFADCIAFIIPRTFKRTSIQNRLSLDFELRFNEDLPTRPCCFTPAMGAKCCFQIWVRSTVPRQKIIMPPTHSDFNFIKYGPKDTRNQPTPPKGAHFVMKAYGSNCGTIIAEGLMSLRPKSWHWIKSNIDVDLLRQRFESLDYSISKDTVRQDSIGQKEVIHLYRMKYNV